MSLVKSGEWRIRCVEVNSTPASDDGGFQVLVTTPTEIRLEPAGITFVIQQATARSAVLESRSQIFFADFLVRGDQLTLHLTRPAFQEKITLIATYDSSVNAFEAFPAEVDATAVQS
ncbi:MAG: hypothetical protein ACR2NP_07115 [Pirellulaceae bacterium]